MPISHEQFSQHLPPEPGTSPLPEGHQRFYHQTPVENVASIKEHGLMLSKAKGIEGPKGTWISEKPFYGTDATHLATLELGLPHDPKRGRIHVEGDIPAHHILAIHEPWHETARGILSDPQAIKETLAGDNDWLSDDPMYGPAIAHVKAVHGVQP